MAEITLGELKARATTTPQILMLELMDLGNAADPYATFVELVDRAIDWVAQEMARNPELRQGLSEDQLTTQVVTTLKAMAFDASHDTKIGGHCDVSIEAREEILWLGEAKKIEKTDNRWLYKGFEQLNSRYSTGNPNQDHGGLIIYCYVARIDRIMKSWKAYLTKRVDGITIKPCARNGLALRSRHTHERTGRPYKVRHSPITLHFDPKDRQL